MREIFLSRIFPYLINNINVFLDAIYFLKDATKDKGKTLLFIDEIQNLISESGILYKKFICFFISMINVNIR